MLEKKEEWEKEKMRRRRRRRRSRSWPGTLPTAIQKFIWSGKQECISYMFFLSLNKHI